MHAWAGSSQQPDSEWKMSWWPLGGCGTAGTVWRNWRMVQLAGAAGKGSTTSRRSGLPSTLPRQAMLPTLVLASLKLFSCALRACSGSSARDRQVHARGGTLMKYWYGTLLRYGSVGLSPNQMSSSTACFHMEGPYVLDCVVAASWGCMLHLLSPHARSSFLCIFLEALRSPPLPAMYSNVAQSHGTFRGRQGGDRPAHHTQVSGALTTTGSRSRYSRGCCAAAAQGRYGWKGPLTSTLSTSSLNAGVRYERGLGVVSQLHTRHRSDTGKRSAMGPLTMLSTSSNAGASCRCKGTEGAGR